MLIIIRGCVRASEGGPSRVSGPGCARCDPAAHAARLAAEFLFYLRCYIMSKMRRVRLLFPVLLILLGCWSLSWLADAQTPGTKPPAELVLKGLEKVVSTSDGKPGLFTLYVDHKEARVLAELPRDFE